MDVPKMMDLAVLYAPGSAQLVQQLLHQLLVLQPRYAQVCQLSLNRQPLKAYTQRSSTAYLSRRAELTVCMQTQCLAWQGDLAVGLVLVSLPVQPPLILLISP